MFNQATCVGSTPITISPSQIIVSRLNVFFITLEQVNNTLQRAKKFSSLSIDEGAYTSIDCAEGVLQQQGTRQQVNTANQ